MSLEWRFTLRDQAEMEEEMKKARQVLRAIWCCLFCGGVFWGEVIWRIFR